MAKAKVLADRIQIESDVLTNENLRKVSMFAPSALVLTDENDLESKILYEVVASENMNTFSKYGAAFKDGKSLGAIEREENDTDETVKENVKLELTAILSKISRIEDQVTEAMNSIGEINVDIEFLG